MSTPGTGKGVHGNAKTTRRKVLCMSSYFIVRYEELKYDSVKRWAKRRGVEDIFTLQRMIVPINICNLHWTFILIDFQKQQIVYMDSLSLPDKKPPAGYTNPWTNMVREYLEKTHYDLTRKELPPEWIAIHGSFPQQEDEFSCGVFVCMSAILLTDPCVSEVNGLVGLPLDLVQSNIPRVREQLVLYILKKELP